MKELTLDAAVENIETVTAFVNEQLEAAGCPKKARLQLSIAIDELFGNIAQYAYASGGGDATIQVELEEAPPAVIITFIDSGAPFDPLAKADPDVTAPAEERGVGGLGIYMVKKSMDAVSYEYRDGRNILRIKKSLLT